VVGRFNKILKHTLSKKASLYKFCKLQATKVSDEWAPNENQIELKPKRWKGFQHKRKKIVSKLSIRGIFFLWLGTGKK
jgi:hypothetical protein